MAKKRKKYRRRLVSKAGIRLAEYAKKVGVARTTIYSWIERGLIEAHGADEGVPLYLLAEDIEAFEAEYSVIDDVL